MNKEQAIIYLAGILDGEGSITLTKDGKAGFRMPVISVASTTYEILEIIQKHFEGSINSKKVYKKHHKPSWIWSIQRRRAISILEQVTPFLTEPKKKNRAQFIIDNYLRVTPRNGKYTEELLIQKRKFEESFFLI